MTPVSLTRQLSAFAAELTIDRIPIELVEKIKLHLLDAIGCGIAGARSDLAERSLRVIGIEHAPGPCRVLGTPQSFGPAAAAFANAVAMNALDYDDGFEVGGKGMGHPGATLVAAALSGGSVHPVDGSTFLAALAAAYEINARLILAIQPSYERFRQVYGVCQHQAIGAAAVFGRLAGLREEKLAEAFGFAGTLTPLPSLRKYNWEARPLVSFKDFNAPAAEAGVRAVQFVQAGLDGARDILDGDTGFWRMIGSDRFDSALLVGGLGETWLARHASFKPYPACRWIHTALESFETLRVSHKLAVEEIEKVVVMTSVGVARDFMDVTPATMVDAQFSLPYCLGRLATAPPAAEWFSTENLENPDAILFARRVEAEIDPAFDAAMGGPERRPAGQVKLRARGKDFIGPRLDYPLGTMERPLRREDIIRKFQANIAGLVPPEEAFRLEDAILSIETARFGEFHFPHSLWPG